MAYIDQLMDKLRERDAILFKRYSEKLNGQFSMKLETTEDAIKWMVEHIGKSLYGPRDRVYRYFGRGFASRVNLDGQFDHWAAVEVFPPGPYYTEKPKPERTIEESLEKLKGRVWYLSAYADGQFVCSFPPEGRNGLAVSKFGLQSALSALVDEIEESK